MKESDKFYAEPTPANAVALAIADAKALRHGTPEFFAQLAKAEGQLRAFPDLLKALQDIIGKTHFTKKNEQDDFNINDLRPAALAAIAKATP